MDIKTNIGEYISESKVIKTGSRTATVHITFDYTDVHTSQGNVLKILYGDLLLSGTRHHNRAEIQHSLKKIGADIEVGMQEGKVHLTAHCLDTNLSKLMAILTEVLIEPVFPVSELKRAKTSLKNNLELTKENARFLADTELKNAFYTKANPEFSFPITEHINNIPKIGVKELKSLHLNILKHHWSITVSGSEKTAVIGLGGILKIKDGTTSIKKISKESFSRAVTKKAVILTEVKSKQNIEVAIGGQLPLKFEDKELPAFIFGLAVLGKWSGFCGRLMSTVREKEGLTYGIYAKTEKIGKNNSGYWRIMTFFSPKETVRGLTSTLREVKLMHEKGISKSELDRFRVILNTSSKLIFDSLSRVTGLTHVNATDGTTWGDYEDFQQRLLSCTQSEVNHAIKKYLNPNKIIISAAGPIESVKKELLSFKK